MMPEFASVCILSYQRLEFLSQSIASLRDVGYPIEIVVGDDGSDPQIQQWLLDALQAGHISRLVLNPPGCNEGVGTMVNRLFSVASGDPLIKSDQDLIYTPGAIGEFVRVLQHNASTESEPRIGTLGGFRYEHDPVDHRKMFKANHELWDEVEDYVSSCLVVSRSVWQEHGPWADHSDAFAEDVEFKHRLSERGFVHGLTIPEVVLNNGFGPPFSTVVRDERDEQGNYKVQTIHHEPRIFHAP